MDRPPLPPSVPHDAEVMWVGRASDCHLIFNDPFVDNYHAVIWRTGGQAWVADLLSTNGTRINGVRLQPGVGNPIFSGTEIWLGARTWITWP